MNTAYSLLLSVVLTNLTLTGTFGADIFKCKKVKKNSMLYMASVQIDGKHRCGGFLIDLSYVMTAAHCDERGNMTVILGTHNISPQGANLKRYTVQHKHKHPSFRHPKNGYDIMLLKLSKKLKIGKGVKTIKIPQKIPNKTLKPKSKCKVAGWGKTEQQNVVNDLSMTEVTNFTTCQTMLKKLEDPLPDNVLCSWGFKKKKSGACEGDSGGPLVCNGEAVGIVSLELYDNQNVLNIYTQISKYTVWIKNVINGGS